MYACRKGKLEVVQRLLSMGADPNITSNVSIIVIV